MEEHILPSRFYKSLVDLLLESISAPDDKGATALHVIEDMRTIDRNDLARQMVKLFLGEGVVLPFLDTLVMQDISKTSRW